MFRCKRECGLNMEERLYFCGSDVYNCLALNQGEKASTEIPVFKKFALVKKCVDVQFTHFYVVYKKQGSENCYSWFMNGLGLSETQIFGPALRISQVATSKNAIVGLSEDCSVLYRIKLEVDDNRELSCLKTTEIKSDESPTAAIPFRKILSNDKHIYGLQSSSEISRICKIEAGVLELVAEFAEKYIVEFSVGYGHFVALSDTGGVWNWGHCGRSELASSSDVSVMSVCEQPRRVEFFDDLPCIIVKIVCGGWHTLALTSDGDIYSWGWNESGQLGHSVTNTSKSEPFPVDLGSAEDPVIDIAAGARHSAALLKSGRVYTWGRHQEGQSGRDNNESCGEPREVEKEWSGTAINLKCGRWSTFVVTK